MEPRIGKLIEMSPWFRGEKRAPCVAIAAISGCSGSERFGGGGGRYAVVEATLVEATLVEATAVRSSGVLLGACGGVGSERTKFRGDGALSTCSEVSRAEVEGSSAISK
jgi:hypothetical protein